MWSHQYLKPFPLMTLMVVAHLYPYSSPLITSGARYSAVPTRLSAFSFAPNSLQCHTIVCHCVCICVCPHYSKSNLHCTVSFLLADSMSSQHWEIKTHLAWPRSAILTWSISPFALFCCVRLCLHLCFNHSIFYQHWKC